MNETLTTFETSKLAKEKGLQLGSERQYVEYHKTYKYDGDANHPESHKKGDVRLGSCSYIVNNKDGIDFSNKYYTLYEAPTQALLQKWLREVHNVHIELYYHWGVPKKYGNNKNYTLLAIWRYSDIGLSQHIEINSKGNYSKYGSYEEVLEIGLQEALKLIP